MNVQFTFHPERCVGCGACIMACVFENQIDIDVQNPYRLLKKNEYVDGDEVHIVYFTNGCMHCQDRFCEKVCPKNCYHVDKSTGIVVLDQESCVGCGRCAKACPYEAIQITKARKAAKCTGCLQNLKRNQLPLCVMACPRRAITIDEKNQVVSQGRERLLEELAEFNRRKEEENG